MKRVRLLAAIAASYLCVSASSLPLNGQEAVQARETHPEDGPTRSSNDRAELMELAKKITAHKLPKKTKAMKVQALPLPEGYSLWGSESRPFGPKGPILVQIFALDDATAQQVSPPADKGASSLQKLHKDWGQHVFFRAADLVNKAGSPKHFVVAYINQNIGLLSLIAQPTAPAIKAIGSCTAFAFDIGFLIAPSVALPGGIGFALSMIGNVGTLMNMKECVSNLADWYATGTSVLKASSGSGKGKNSNRDGSSNKGGGGDSPGAGRGPSGGGNSGGNDKGPAGGNPGGNDKGPAGGNPGGNDKGPGGGNDNGKGNDNAPTGPGLATRSAKRLLLNEEVLDLAAAHGLSRIS